MPEAQMPPTHHPHFRIPDFSGLQSNKKQNPPDMENLFLHRRVHYSMLC
jgi:hypothetical protein